MRFFSFSKALVIAATTTFIMACGGGSPADKLMGYQEKILSILEDNKGDLDKAAKLVGEYLASNKDAMKQTMAEMEKMEEELKSDPAKMQSLMEEFEKKKKAMEERMEKLEKDAPGIKEHEGLKAAMRGMID